MGRTLESVSPPRATTSTFTATSHATTTARIEFASSVKRFDLVQSPHSGFLRCSGRTQQSCPSIRLTRALLYFVQRWKDVLKQSFLSTVQILVEAFFSALFDRCADPMAPIPVSGRRPE